MKRRFYIRCHPSHVILKYNTARNKSVSTDDDVAKSNEENQQVPEAIPSNQNDAETRDADSMPQTDDSDADCAIKMMDLTLSKLCNHLNMVCQWMNMKLLL